MALQQPLPSDPDALEALFNEDISNLQDFPFDTSRTDKSVLEILRAEPKASVFFSLIEKHADLLSLLQDPSNGEYTVFVPLDSAWKLDGELLSQVQEDEDVRRSVLSAHISPHYVTTEGLTLMSNVRTLLKPSNANGWQIIRAQRSHKYEINEIATLTTGNITAKNGILHFIDRALAPPPSALGVVQSRSELDIFNKALGELGLTDDLEGVKGRTFFAPTDDAFKKLGADTLDFLFDAGKGHRYLRALVKYHISPNVTFYTNMIWPQNDTGHRIPSSEKIKAIKGQQTKKLATLAVDVANGQPAHLAVHIARYKDLIPLTLNDNSHVVAHDIQADDGVVQVVDAVLLPDEGSPSSASGAITLEELKQLLAPFVEAEQ